MAADSRNTRRHRGQSRKGILGRFWERVSPEPNSGCWLWTGAGTPQGYGSFYMNGRQWAAYAAAYEIFVGPFPAGLELDHKCRVTWCVNPAHLEPVTHQENVRRGFAGAAQAAAQRAKTNCPHGHPYDEDNTYRRKSGHRDCRICGRVTSRDFQRKRRENMTPEQREKVRTYGREWMRRKRAASV